MHAIETAVADDTETLADLRNEAVVHLGGWALAGVRDYGVIDDLLATGQGGECSCAVTSPVEGFSRGANDSVAVGALDV